MQIPELSGWPGPGDMTILSNLFFDISFNDILSFLKTSTFAPNSESE